MSALPIFAVNCTPWSNVAIFAMEGIWNFAWVQQQGGRGAAGITAGQQQGGVAPYLHAGDGSPRNGKSSLETSDGGGSGSGSGGSDGAAAKSDGALATSRQ